jgi:hypothetical protein
MLGCVRKDLLTRERGGLQPWIGPSIGERRSRAPWLSSGVEMGWCGLAGAQLILGRRVVLPSSEEATDRLMTGWSLIAAMRPLSEGGCR